ncbi:SH3 domain-containing protein Dlish [Musca vetustissima]|uniref:SH3 domain-containing protein Dlish n=1 Tax=Musca vetustissima TaxID=27455 RepID=UPI002AB7CEA6|nr:SH3 domain-containing protein Dlish [Musca vetustissima]
MAFLCPVRMRRDKKKATNANIERDLPLPGGVTVGLGRITGSSSIETLVRVGIEKEHGLSPDSKMVVLHDFTPCVDDELEVKRGQVVNILYRENDWVYVIGEDSRQEGFIPYSYCAPYNTQLADMAIKKKLPRGESGEHSETIPLISPTNDTTKLDLIEEVSNAQAALKNAVAELNSPLLMDGECTPFHKEPNGRYIVLYTFIARDENDLSVERGEFVTLLNRDDVDWFWIVRSDGQEGFVPSAFIYPADSVLQTQQKLMENSLSKSNGQISTGSGATQGNLNSLSQPVTMPSNGTTGVENPLQTSQQQGQHNSQNSSAQIPADDVRYGTELVMLYDYKAQAPDDLSVRRGDWIYADLNNQTVDGWLWSYAPKTRKYGFIPKAYARPPAMTSL